MRGMRCHREKRKRRIVCDAAYACAAKKRDYITVVLPLIIVLFIGDLPARKRFVFVQREYEPKG